MAILRHVYLLYLAGCATPGQTSTHEPWNGKIYIGNPEKQAIERSQDGESIACDKPEFGKMVCIPSDDFHELLVRFIENRANAGMCQ